MSEPSPNSNIKTTPDGSSEIWRIPDFPFNYIREAIFVVDGPTMSIMDCNHYTETLTGYTRDEIIGKTPAIFHQDMSEYDLLIQAMATGLRMASDYSVEHSLYRKNNEELAVEHLVHLIGDREKGFFTIHIVRDISARKADEKAQQRTKEDLENQVRQRTAELAALNEELREEIEERKRAEQTANHSRDRVQLLLKNLPGMAYSCTNEEARRMEYVSEGCLGLTGFPHEDLLGSRKFNYLDLVVPEDRAMIWQTIHQAVARDEIYRLTYRITTASGVTKWVSEIGRGVHDEKGRIAFLEGFILDVTREREAESVLRTNEERYRTLVELSTEPIVVIQDLKIAYANPAGLRFFGVETAHEVLGKPFLEWVHPDSRESVKMRLQAASVLGVVNPPKEHKLLRKDGSIIIVEAASNSTFFGGKIATQVILHDITTRKYAEEELARYSLELKRSNADLEQFAYVASHDLQEPLRMVSSFMQLLERKYAGKLDAEAEEAIGFAVDGAHRMQRLIDDLLTYSRVGTRGQPFQKVDLNQVAGEVMENLRLAIQEADAEVTVNELPTISADRTQMVQLFSNLVGNALKFRGDKKLSILIGAEQQEDGFWRCWVRDNGIGIDPQFQERIFIIFQRLHTRAEYPGTGIGLAICKKIVERHGGTIWVESQVGQGATFFFTLPKD